MIQSNESGTDQVYDAIVVGTGISGGWAAKELCEAGLKTLVLDRGRMVTHIEDYPTANLDPWDMENGGATRRENLNSIERDIPPEWRINIFLLMILNIPIMRSEDLIGCAVTTWGADL